MKENESIESVEAVDELMVYFRNGATPPDAKVVRAYELGINVKMLKLYIEEVELEETDGESEWS